MDTQTAINSPPDPGGVAYFDLDADPPPAPPLDTEKFANFSATAAGNSAILLTWQLNTNIQFTCKIERRENDGNWGELTVVDSQADDTYLDESVSAGVIYHYRLTAMQGNAELFGSREKMCDVPCPVEVETPIADGEELNPLKYKFKLSNPPAGGLTLEWMEFYATGCHPDKADLGQFRRAGPKRSWTIPSGATESEEYTTAGHFESSVGCYAVVGIPRISLILGSGVPNLQYITCPEHNTPFDTKEPVFFAVNDSELPDTRYVLSWQGSDTLRVTKGGGAPLSSPLTFTQEELDSYSSFKVVASGLAGDGDSLTVNLQTFASVDYITGGEIEMGTDSHTFYFSGPPAPPDSSSLSVPVDEASGAKYRKIALNGRPLSDEKPQAAAEDDQQREETFVDALTLGLRHNVSDAWLPVNGSELALTVRRSTASEVWSERFGLRPHERPDLPFGAGWSSNLTAQVKIVRSSNDADYAYVTDENGAVYRFVIWGQNFFPFPTAKHEQNTYLTSLEFAADGNRLVFKRKFGSVLEYTATGLDYHMSHDRMNGSEDYDDISYYRLVKITDRLGQVVNWIYAAGGQQLVPMRIEAEGRADQTLYLRINGSGLVTNIWDANWNRTDYTYEHDADRDIWLLVKVTAADGAETSYGYDFAAEQDLTPQLQGPNVYLHCDVGGITDPNNQTYAIGYMFNHDGTSTGKYNYYRSDDFPAGIYYPATGEGRMVSGVTLPGGGVTQFENYSLTKLVKLSDNDDDDAAVLSADSLRKTRVRDATGRWRTYQWGNPLAHFIRTLSNYYSGKHITTPKIIYYRTMDLTHEGFGTEHYEFDVNAGLNVSRTVDLSGNETEFEYSDTWTTSGLAADYHSIIPLSAGVNGCYDDPTAQMRKLGDNWLIKDFSYSDQRVMKGMVDELGRRTVYDVDALGRRTAERVYPAGSDTPLQVTLFEYSANFPGVVTRKTMQKQAADGAPGWAADLVTQYVIDNAGRVAQEVTNPGGLALTVSREYDAQGNKISATDPNGNQTLYVYDQRNRLTRITHADDAEQVFAYDGNGNKVSATDENGHVTQFAYDPLNRLVKQTRVMGADSAGNLVTQFAYNAANAKTSQTDPNGHVTRFEYDGLQRLVKTIDALHQPTVYAYGANSGGDTFNVSTFKPTQTVDPRGYVTEVEYDSLYRAVKTRVQYNMERGRLARQPGAPAASRPSRGQQTADALSDFAETLNAYDDVGNLIHTTDPLGHVTQTTYDALNRPLTVTNPDGSTVSAAYTSTGLKWRVTDELGRQTDTRYDAAGRPIEVYAPALADGQRALTVTGYDAAGNVTLTVNPLGQAWTFAYDNRNRKISEQQPAVADAADGQTKHPLLLTAYDAVGNVTATTDANGNVTVSEYDAANRVIKVTDALGHDTLTVYDRNGNIVNVSDANGKVTHNQYDALNRLTRTTDAAGITVSYEYDAVGNRVAVTDGKNHPTRFTYDGLNRQLTESDPLNHTVTFAYDAINKIRRADAKGQITAYTYDSRNRPLTVTYQGRAQDHRQYTYDAAGNVTWATDRATVAYVYDALNRIVQETSAGRTHNYEYDLAGNRTKAIYGGSNRELVSTYDALNRLQTVSETGRVTTYAYDLNGNIAALTLPNGDVTTNLYDALNRCTNKTTNNHDNVTLSGYAQEYDHVGNVTKITETYAAAADNRVITNTYDNIYRLTRELITGAAARDTRYTYDRANNRTGKTADGEQTNYTYNAVNQLLAVSGAAGAVFDYDANGNRWHAYAEAADLPPPPANGDHLLTESGFGLLTEDGDKLIVERTAAASHLTTEDGFSLLTESGDNLIVEKNAAAVRLLTESGFSLLTESGDHLIVSEGDADDGDAGGEIPHGEQEELYEYDYENRLVKLTRTISGNAQEYRYGYDYRTRRVLRNEGNGDETVSFSGGTSVSEWSGDNYTSSQTPNEVKQWGSAGIIPLVEYIRGSDYGGGIGGILYTLRNNVPSFTHYDARGDVIQKVNADGAVTYQAQYEAFGSRTKETGQTQDRQKANTKDEDSTGLLNEGYRYRDLKYGVFITKDPAAFIDGPNLYTYVRQNPWTKFDPHGLKPGDSYNTFDETLYNASMDVYNYHPNGNQRSAKDVEYASNIYKNKVTGKYGYTTPYGQQSPVSVEIKENNIPEGTTFEGATHSHPERTYSANSKEKYPTHKFSDKYDTAVKGSEGDKGWADANEKPLGLVTKNIYTNDIDVKKYTPLKGSAVDTAKQMKGEISQYNLETKKFDKEKPIYPQPKADPTKPQWVGLIGKEKQYKMPDGTYLRESQLPKKENNP